MRRPPQNPSSPIASGDARLDSAAFHRNHEPIWAVLSRWLENKPGNVLEVGSGTGQHIIEFARKAPHLLWWPSDYDERNVESIEAWCRHAKLQNVEAARRLELCARKWGLSAKDSAALRRLIHISFSTRAVAVRSSTRRGTREGAKQDRSFELS